MKLAVHQPQYLPWFPYLMKIEKADIFVLLDTADFQKNGVQNRNAIKTPNGAQWLTVPVIQKLGTKIKDIEIADQNWQKKHWKAIVQNYSKAAYFTQYAGIVESWFVREWKQLSDLNNTILTDLLAMFEIETPIDRTSNLPFTDAKATDMLVCICKHTGAKEYISGMGGKAYMDESAFENEGIKIHYESPLLPKPYTQCYQKVAFMPDLSSLDILLNCGPSWRTYI